jgi:hypothetical protein
MSHDDGLEATRKWLKARHPLVVFDPWEVETVAAFARAEVAAEREKRLEAERERDEAQRLASLRRVQDTEAALEAANARAAMLDDAVSDAIYAFHEKAHPGHPALKAMVRESTVAEWRKARQATEPEVSRWIAEKRRAWRIEGWFQALCEHDTGVSEVPLMHLQATEDVDRYWPEDAPAKETAPKEEPR